MDRIFCSNHIGNLCQELVADVEACRNALDEIVCTAHRVALAISEVPVETREFQVDLDAQFIGDLRDRIDFDEIIRVIKRVELRACEIIPEVDRDFASETQELMGQMDSLKHVLSDMMRFMDETPLSTNSLTFLGQLFCAGVRWEISMFGVNLGLEALMNSVKGHNIRSQVFTFDPVNLSTGNLIFQKTDLKGAGNYSFDFRRFYNALNTRAGALGKDWIHNYEVSLEGPNNEKRLILEDGQEIIYLLQESGDYISAFHGNGFLTKREEGYTYTTKSKTIYSFNKEGQWIKQEDFQGNILTLSYDEKKLQKIERQTGEHFLLSYNKDGILAQVEDHTGRKVMYTYFVDLLQEVTSPNGHKFGYFYGSNKKLVSVKNPQGIEIVECIYDDGDKVVHQKFADGTTMAFDYDMTNQQVKLTERNEGQVTYVHDHQFRDVKRIYPNGEERFEYNQHNQKTLVVDKAGNKTQYGYDFEENLTRIINPLKEKIEFQYSKEGQLVAVFLDGEEKLKNGYDEGYLTETKDALGNKTTFIYGNKTQKLETVKDKCLPKEVVQADGSRIRFNYDKRGNITEYIDPFGGHNHYTYDDLNQLIESIDGNGNKTSFCYDKEGNLIKVKNSVGDIRRYEYNQSNKVTTVIDYDGSTLTREYNSINKPSKTIDQLGRETLFQYDSMWNLARVTEPNGAKTTWFYDEYSKLSRIKKDNGGTINFTYDKVGNRTSIEDEEGVKTFFSYNALGRLLTVIGEEGLKISYTYNNLGNITSITDALGNVVKASYDGNGRLIKEVNPLGGSRSYTYTPLGKIATIEDEAGLVTTYSYVKGGRLQEIIHPDSTKEIFSYDLAGNVKSHRDKIGKVQTYAYDSLNRIINIADSSGRNRSFTYDAVSNVTSMTDELNHVTKYEYTLTGKLAKVIDSQGSETRYTYDECNRLIEVQQLGLEILGTDEELERVIQQNRENLTLHVIKYERDKMGQVISITDGLGEKESFLYNKRGQLIEKLDKEGYLTRYGYTTHGDVSHIQYADGKEVKMSYNVIRQLTELEDWLGKTQIELDSLGRLTKVINHQDKEVSYAWGVKGEKRSVTYPEGKVVTYDYDDLMRLSQIDDGVNKVSYKYNKRSQLSEKIFQNGTGTVYSYDSIGRLEELNNFDVHKVLDKYIYQYDLSGNKNKIIKERKNLSEDTGVFEYIHDSLNRIQEITKDGVILRSYDYDGYGNRTTLKEDNSTIHYTYNALNQLISSVDSHINGDDTDEKEEGNLAYTYDKRGNLTEIFKNNQLIHQYHYGSLNRLEKVYNLEKQLGATYQYNGLGHRVGKVEGELLEPLLPIVDSTQLSINPMKQIDDVLDLSRKYNNLLQREENQSITSFAWDFNVLSAKGEDGSYYNYLQDSLGNPVRLLDRVSDVQEVYAYDEFGERIQDEIGTIDQPFTYTGYQRDDIAGTYFAQAREYQPQLGRFASTDTIKGDIAFPFTINEYGYCWNSPLNLVDLDGLQPTLEDVFTPEFGEYDPLKMVIVDNTITLDVYVCIRGDVDTLICGREAEQLAIQGIEMWAGNYSNVFDRDVTVEVNVHVSSPDSNPNQNYIPVYLNDGAGVANLQPPPGGWTPINPGVVTLYVYRDGYILRYYWGYRNTSGHEFGHVFGMGDAAACSERNRPRAPMADSNDIMRWHLSEDYTHISNLNIQMMLMAMHTGERQSWMTYNDRVQSPAVFECG